MRPSFAILCTALALAGCRGSGSGLLGRMTIPPPGTQPPGALLADNAYYPRQTAAAEASTPTIPVPSSALPVIQPSQPSQPSFTLVAERRGAAIARSTLAAPVLTPAPAAPSREEPIRIPDNSASVGTLASVVRIQGIPTTDATGLFQTVRTQLQPQASLASRTPSSSGFVEISQLPNAFSQRLR